jgi:hypothetical protein
MKQTFKNIAVISTVVVMMVAAITMLLKSARTSLKKIDENRRSQLVLNTEKAQHYRAVITEAINVLDGKLIGIEKSSGIRAPSFIIREDQLPCVFRYRLSTFDSYSLSDYPRILNELFRVMYEVILFEGVVATFPGSQRSEFMDHYSSAHSLSTGEYASIRWTSDESLRELMSIFNSKMQVLTPKTAQK